MTITITKYAHACVRLTEGDRALVFDPGFFSDAAETAAALEGASAVLITHEHADHLVADTLRAAVKANDDLAIWAPAGIAADLADLGDHVHTAGVGQDFQAAGFTVSTHGGHHAVIHPLIEQAYVPNIGYLVSSSSSSGTEGDLPDSAGSVYHPGDSLVVPPGPVGTVLVPVSGPWLKTGEALDFIIASRAAHAHPIHDRLLSETGLGLVNQQASMISERYGVDYRKLDVGESSN